MGIYDHGTFDNCRRPCVTMGPCVTTTTDDIILCYLQDLCALLASVTAWHLAVLALVTQGGTLPW